MKIFENTSITVLKIEMMKRCAYNSMLRSVLKIMDNLLSTCTLKISRVIPLNVCWMYNHILLNTNEYVWFYKDGILENKFQDLTNSNVDKTISSFISLQVMFGHVCLKMLEQGINACLTRHLLKDQMLRCCYPSQL